MSVTENYNSLKNYTKAIPNCLSFSKPSYYEWRATPPAGVLQE
jgi:hypothetical protein